jgi:hypothetical protein
MLFTLQDGYVKSRSYYKRILLIIGDRLGGGVKMEGRGRDREYVRHVTGTDQDYLRKSPEVVVQISASTKRAM